MIGKPYSSKIPVGVRNAMSEFADGECFLVQRARCAQDDQSTSGQCHAAVDERIQASGGKRIQGWMLIQPSAFKASGIYNWVFHSVWQPDDGPAIDITYSDAYAGKKYVTFWQDQSRSADLEEGTNLNNVIVFTDIRSAAFYSAQIQTKIEVNTPYWTDPYLSCIVAIDEHSGYYRYLHPQYEKNRYLFEQKYGPIDQIGQSNRLIRNTILLDFSLGLRC